MNITRNNPYVGPRTFSIEERQLFFGREREARDLVALVVSEQLLLFYAQSGAGKSSLINARLIPDLEREGFEVLPVGRLSGDLPYAVTAENVYVYNLLRSLVTREIDTNSLATLTLTHFLAGLDRDGSSYWFNESKPPKITRESEEYSPQRPVLIIDQFEELFNTHPEAWQKREDFFNQLSQAMRDHPAISVVLVMREDYIASLDPYAHLLLGGLRVRYYMQRLGYEGALRAIKGPVEGLRPFAQGVAEKIANDLRSIIVRKPDNTWEAQIGQYVEPVQLQVVCSSLWEKLPPHGTEITPEELDQYVGEINTALGNFYEERVRAVAYGRRAKEIGVRERDLRRWFEEELIFEGKRRGMVVQEPGGKSGGLADEIVREFVGSLVRVEKRAGATFYELTHDRMVEPIIENNRQWDLKNSSPFRSQVEDWEKTGRRDIFLISDQVLTDAEQWANENPDKLTSNETEFLDASRVRQHELDEEQEREFQLQKLDAVQKLTEEQERLISRARRVNTILISLLIILIATALMFTLTRGAQTLITLLLIIASLILGYYFGRNKAK